jgi:hypothetical protein
MRFLLVFSVILAFIIEAFVEQHKLKQSEDNAPKLNGFIEGSVWDDEIRSRIEIALNRSMLRFVGVFDAKLSVL